MPSQINSVLFALLVLAKFSVSNLIQARDPPCSAAVDSLATGIRDNIDVQRNELKLATQLSNILAADAPNETDFTSTTASLLTTVKQGITVRQKNQAIAPAGNGAIAGLATVAKAQEEELSLTQSIGVGGINVNRDKATVTKLMADFNGGIDQNQKNLEAATAGCKVSTSGKKLQDRATQNGTTLNGNAPNGTAPDDNAPNGNAPNGTAPDGTTLNGAPNSNAPNGNAPNGNAPNDNAPNGNAPNGNAPNGNAPNGNAPNGNAPNGNAPTGNAPNGNAPNGNAPNGNAPNDAAKNAAKR